MRWKVLKSLDVFKAGFFKLRVDECQLPDGRVNPRYYVMEFPSWVNVVPITEDGRMVLVRQYRHAADDIYLEIPGGSADSLTEDPRAAGERELREETGFVAKEFIPCGFHSPNPALQNNKLYTYLALGCVKSAEQDLDPFEDLEVVTLPVNEVFELWAKGEIRHSLIAASLGLALRPLRERGFLINPLS